MDNRPIPPGQKPTSQLGPPPPIETAFDSSPEEGTPVNPNSGIDNAAPSQPKPGFLSKLNDMPAYQKLPAPVRDFVGKRPIAAAGIAVLAGLGLLVARRRPRHA